MVKFAALNYSTCATWPVKQPVSNQKEYNSSTENIKADLKIQIGFFCWYFHQSFHTLTLWHVDTSTQRQKRQALWTGHGLDRPWYSFVFLFFQGRPRLVGLLLDNFIWKPFHNMNFLFFWVSMLSKLLRFWWVNTLENEARHWNINATKEFFSVKHGIF